MPFCAYRSSGCLTALAIVPTPFDNASMAKQKRAKKRPDPARFGFDMMQRVIAELVTILGGLGPRGLARGDLVANQVERKGDAEPYFLGVGFGSGSSVARAVRISAVSKPSVKRS